MIFLIDMGLTKRPFKKIGHKYQLVDSGGNYFLFCRKGNKELKNH